MHEGDQRNVHADSVHSHPEKRQLFHTEVSADPEAAVAVQLAGAATKRLLDGDPWLDSDVSGRNSAVALRQISSAVRVNVRLRHHCINSGYNSGRRELGGPGGADQAHSPTVAWVGWGVTFLWQH